MLKFEGGVIVLPDIPYSQCNLAAIFEVFQLNRHHLTETKLHLHGSRDDRMQQEKDSLGPVITLVDCAGSKIEEEAGITQLEILV